MSKMSQYVLEQQTENPDLLLQQDEYYQEWCEEYESQFEEQTDESE